MTSYDQFNDRLNQRDNRIPKYENNAITLDIEVITRCEDIRHDERRNARRVQRNQRRTDVMKQRDSERSLEESRYRYYF